MKVYNHVQTYTWVFIAAMFIMARKWEQSKSVNAKWANRSRLHAMGYPPMATWVDLESIMLSGKSQTQEATQECGLTPFLQNVQSKKIILRVQKHADGCQAESGKGGLGKERWRVQDFCEMKIQELDGDSCITVDSPEKLPNCALWRDEFCGRWILSQ